MHGFHCYGNITRTRNVSEYMLVLALCLVVIDFTGTVCKWLVPFAAHVQMKEINQR